MKSEFSGKVQQFLQWKLETNNLRIDESQIAKYFKISELEATEILANLIKSGVVQRKIKCNCPQCEMLYSVKNIDDSIQCTECGNKFTPKDGKRYIRYYYFLKELKEDGVQRRPRRALYELDKESKEGIFMGKKKNVFLSYSHKDETFKEQLDIHFSALKRSDRIATWNDRKMLPGAILDEEIKKQLRNADIVILLISADFIASNYCYEIEMQEAIERAKKNECIMIPVILRPCAWADTPLGDFLALPKDGKAIAKYELADDAYLEVVSGVKIILESMD